MARQLKHRCAVCWEQQQSHEDWRGHALQQHGSDMFGFGACQHEDACQRGCVEHVGTCPGVEHARRLPNYGTERVKRAAPEPRPFTARDGAVYTPRPLPIDGGA